MPYETIIGTLESVNDRLNGVVLTRPITVEGIDLDGLELVFTQPAAATVAFTGSYTPAALRDHINTTLGTTAASLRSVRMSEGSRTATVDGYRGSVFLVLQDDTNGVVLSASTAAIPLGIPSPLTSLPIALSRVHSFGQDSSSGFFFALIAP